MEKQENYIYENVALTFQVSGQPITGTLEGTFKLWDFRSTSPYFLKFYPGGLLRNTMFYFDLKTEHRLIFDAVQDAAEDKGYIFNPDEEKL